MRFFRGKQDMHSLEASESGCVLLTNGLGGYASATAAYSVNRCDHGILVAAVRAPNERIMLVHRTRESISTGGKRIYISSQKMAGKAQPERGYCNLSGFSMEGAPVWCYQIGGIRVTRTLCVAREENTSALIYEIENNAKEDCSIQIDPFLKFAPKEETLQEKKDFSYSSGVVTDGKYDLHIKTNGSLRKISTQWQRLSYTEDAKDGRPETGYTGCCCRIAMDIPAGAAKTLEIVFSAKKESRTGAQILQAWTQRRKALLEDCPFIDPIARQLVLAADDYIVHRDSTNEKTIIAGYPLFSDWGRDTMIALPGCCLATGRYDDAKSILRTFLAYEKDGLVPNLFPEGGNQPMYNTVDAALLLIDALWQYVQRTGDFEFVREAWPVMKRIVAAYRKGTHHSIGMDDDGLIFAGGGLDQVTWMDVCVNGILPTPRHGKPVEINAYWYNALRIMDALAQKLDEDPADYLELAAKVKKSFVEKFYMEQKGYLKDVLSGTKADEQLRCNQIWAVSMPFTMLEPEQERSVVETVYRHLYTPCGLRTLSPEDPEFHPTYGGEMLQRDLAYHQGTTWVFPMGAYYLAYLKVHGFTKEAAKRVREQTQALLSMLSEGCLGQLPEIYDGEIPAEGKGCFAQAWSVGEMLRVLEAVERIENE